MVFDLISFSAGLYFGFRHSDEDRWSLLEKSIPYGFAVAAAFTLLAALLVGGRETFAIEVLAYFFVAFTLGAIAGSISGRRLKRAFRVEEG
ncbi:MAG: hypothetical protein GXO66_10450 [Euryarchaeota archaeon]|nr:hypothetical protein [Euryarchaeota archaeon]